MSQLVTGDAVLLDLRPARIPTRMLSVGIDLALMFGATYLYGYIVDRVGGSPARVRAVTIAGALLINFGYLIAMETLTRGRTVGAFALGLRVVRDDGGAIRFRQALLRGLAFWGVDFAIWTGFCGGLICAAVNPMSKRFGDLMAGTIVIRTRAPRPPEAVPPIPDRLSAWAAQLELSGLSDELVTAARHLVQRSTGLSGYPRDQLGQRPRPSGRRTHRPRRRRPPAPVGIPGRGGRRASAAGAIQDGPPAVGARGRGASCRLAVTPRGRELYAQGMESGTRRTLILVRHAKSSWNFDVDDHDRPLSGRGRRDAEAVGRVLTDAAAPARSGVVLDRHADPGDLERRGQASEPARPRWSIERAIYHAWVPELVGLVRQTPDTVSTLLMIGHAPGIPDLVEHLCVRTDSADWAQLDHKFPTSGLVVIKVPGPWPRNRQGTRRARQLHRAAGEPSPDSTVGYPASRRPAGVERQIAVIAWRTAATTASG